MKCYLGCFNFNVDELMMALNLLIITAKHGTFINVKKITIIIIIVLFSEAI